MIPVFLLRFATSIVGPKFAKLAVIGTAILLLLALLGLGKCAYDRSIIRNHDAKQEAKVQKAVVGADRYASQQKDIRDQTFANSQASIGNSVGNAVAANPQKAKQPVGPASQAYYDELRRQQKGKRR